MLFLFSILKIKILKLNLNQSHMIKKNVIDVIAS